MKIATSPLKKVTPSFPRTPSKSWGPLVGGSTPTPLPPCRKGGVHTMWFLRYKAQQTEFFVILGHFLTIDPPKNLKHPNFEKMKKLPGDIILHLSTTDVNHMMYGSWDLEYNRQNF